jgi:hypothetical protein
MAARVRSYTGRPRNAKLFYINSIGYVGATGNATIAPSKTTDYSGSVSDTEDKNGQTGNCPATLQIGKATSCPPGKILQNGLCVDPSEICPDGYAHLG